LHPPRATSFGPLCSIHRFREERRDRERERERERERKEGDSEGE